MGRDYQCDGCGKFYDLNSYGGGSTCNSCGGQIQLIRDEDETYSVYFRKDGSNEMSVVRSGLDHDDATKLKEQKIKEVLDQMKKKLELEYLVQKD